MRNKLIYLIMFACLLVTGTGYANQVISNNSTGNDQATYESTELTKNIKEINETTSAAPEVSTVVLTSDNTPYQIALQNNLTLSELDKLNNGELSSKEIIKAGESVILPANSIMAKLAQPKQTTTNQKSAITLPSLGNGKKSDDESYLTQILDEVPASNYLENDAEKNAAILIEDAATRDWENFEAQNLIDDAEIWAENYVDGKVNAAKSKVLSQANSYLNKPINDLLGRFGTAQFSLSVDEKGDFTASDFKLFSPLYDVDQNLVFGQVGVHEQGSGNEERLIGNFGLGYRYDTDDYLVGGNVFIDHDFTGSNTRLGLGGEYWRNYLKLAVNYYAPLSDWKSSEVLLDFEERPAEGFDIRTQAYLPSYPQLGGSLVYEQYFGDEVAYFGLENRQSDPYAVTVGLDYTPIPLITTNAGYTLGKSGEAQAQFDLDLNLQLGVPIEQQLDPSRVADLRTLKGSRYDPVDRNYDIVFEYRAKALEVEIKAIEAVIPVRTEAQIVKVRISNESNIVNHVWYRFDEITQAWNAVADESDSSIERLDDLRNSVGKYKYKLFVKTETGATGVSNTVEVEVIAGQGATLDNMMEDDVSYVSSNTTWDDIDNINELETNPIYNNKFIKLYYQTEEYLPDSYEIELFAASRDIERQKITLLPEDEIASYMSSNPNVMMVGIKKAVDADPEDPAKHKGWYIYVLADNALLDVGEMQINFEFDALTRDDLTGQPVVSSNIENGTFYSNSFEPNIFANMYVELSVIDLGQIPSTTTRSARFMSNNDELINFEQTVCENITNYESRILSKTTYKIATLDGKVLPSEAGNKSVEMIDYAESKPAYVDHYYGVCIIHTKSEVLGGETVEVIIPEDPIVLNEDVQNSIVWRYGIDDAPDLYSKGNVDLRDFESDEQGIQEILTYPQDETKGARIARYNGLEGCRARMIFRTQTSNVDNNEFVWGDLGKDAVEQWTEQGLQLSVQFNTIDMNDGRVLPEIDPICPSYTDLVSITDDAKDQFIKSGRFDENNIENDTLLPTSNGDYVGVWH
ncbi:inverse autotransporter beta domain-containing protein [Thorsellia anophelis]|uniref:Invasin beta-domain of outer membrane n=1 Tax=Thorsellia anophelis DSM 18579 TaxID=1123402 RepID=A0A1I0ALW6_9GAMM|nr:inverse autotransporter beta domain-containing protein [Thorsellia anophelis]SES95356.1 Invasin beta-domain of outer membrane [Thorsellia anophelis DSM 18579]